MEMEKAIQRFHLMHTIFKQTFIEYMRIQKCRCDNEDDTFQFIDGDANAQGEYIAQNDFMDSSDKDRETNRKQRLIRDSEDEVEFKIDYTIEQLNLVRKVISSENYYEALNIPSNASVKVIRQSFRKLALKLHPDKNYAPGAKNAFQKISRAVLVLTSKTERALYDMKLINVAVKLDQTQEDKQKQEQCTKQQPTQQYGLFVNVSSTTWILSVILGVLAMLFFTVIVNFRSPTYEVTKSENYPVLRRTQRFNVPYYVKESFEFDFKGSIKRLEQAVEEDYLYTLRNRCREERSYRNAILLHTRNSGHYLKYAHALATTNTPSCETLGKLGLN